MILFPHPNFHLFTGRRALVIPGLLLLLLGLLSFGSLVRVSSYAGRCITGLGLGVAGPWVTTGGTGRRGRGRVARGGRRRVAGLRGRGLWVRRRGDRRGRGVAWASRRGWRVAGAGGWGRRIAGARRWGWGVAGAGGWRGWVTRARRRLWLRLVGRLGRRLRVATECKMS